jgi:hypothetical protein
MIDDDVSWLAREVKDLLDVSSVGLYEFIWLLRARRPGMPVDESRIIAEAALQRLLSDGVGRLVLLTWPSDEPGGSASFSALRPADWDDPQRGIRYVALTPT